MKDQMKRFLILLLLVLSPQLRAAPFYVDLTGVANTALEDDGIANNGKGGWSDEGVNDMFIYPPIEFGEVVRNGYHFLLPKPATPLASTVVMLRGERRAQSKPEKVEIAVPDKTGKFLYLLLNAVGEVPKQPADYLVANCSVRYADGSLTNIPLRDGIEIRQWWTGAWWDNNGAASWPFFMGRNYYSMKWNKFIGVWAMEWQNPHPELPIHSLTFTSAGKAAPVIWAATLDDVDYHANEATVKTDFKRPDGVPENYFEPRAEIERTQLFKAAAAEKLIEGVLRVELLRPDLIAVTVDGALGASGAGDGGAQITGLTATQNFAVASVDDKRFGAGTPPVEVGRNSYETGLHDVPGFPACKFFWHTFYLRLAVPLQSGHKYTVRVANIAKEFRSEIELAYDVAKTTTPAIKVNQVAYSSRATRRYAYLGWWAGNLGKVDYADWKTFQVINESGNKVALEGAITPRQLADPLSGEDVYEMDLAKLAIGQYHIVVPGLGRSDSFGVGGDGIRQLYYHAMRAFFYQRCGQELKKPYSEFARPACHIQAYESGFMVGNSDYLPKPGEAIREFRGGYHDAGDCDVFTYHLRSTAQALVGFEHADGKLRDGDLNIPESGNKIPDVLDEADWALSGYLAVQNPDGSVPLGRGNDEDYIRDHYRNKPRPAFGLLPPCNTSSTEYAAVAAQFARLIRPLDAKRAATYAASAERALAWALAHPVNPEKDENERATYLFQAWAAAELFETTGKPEYNETFLRLHQEKKTEQVHWGLTGWRPLCTWTYATSSRTGVSTNVQAQLRKWIINSGNDAVKHTDANPYRMGHDGRGLGWGNGNGGGHYGDVCLRAYWLTGDQRYLDTASLNADFLLGANPISRTFMTSVGARYPHQPELNQALYELPNHRGRTAAGITNYGLCDSMPPGFPKEIPRWRRVLDIRAGGEISSEFTITETIGASAILFNSLWPLELRAP